MRGGERTGEDTEERKGEGRGVEGTKEDGGQQTSGDVTVTCLLGGTKTKGRGIVVLLISII